jgi:hypothetical protein
LAHQLSDQVCLSPAPTDLLVASVDDGRFDAGALAEALAWLVDNDFMKLNRLEA